MNLNLNDRNIIIFGDSLSAGRYTPGNLLGHVQMKEWSKPKQVTVVAVGGMALSYFRPSYLKLKTNTWSIKARTQLGAARWVSADMVLVMLGTNDYLSPQLHVLDGAKNLIEQLRKDKNPPPDVYFIGPPSFDPNMRDGKVMKGINRFYQAMNFVYGSKVFDTRPQSADLTTKEYRPDLIHFTKKGAEIYAGRMMQLLQGGKMGPRPKQSPLQIDWGMLAAIGGAYALTKWFTK